MLQKIFTVIVYIGAIVLGLLFGAGLSLSRLDAQEITPEATTEPIAPIVVEDDGGFVIVEAPKDAPIISNEIVLALVAVVGLLTGVVVGIRKGEKPDQSVAAHIEQLQQNRATMELLERQLAAKDAVTRMAFDTFAGFFKLIAPFTPLLTDDAVSKFLEDLKNEGPPETPPAPGSLSRPKRID